MKVSGSHFSHHVILDELPVPNHSDEEYLKMDQETDENRQRKQSMHNIGDEDELLDFFSLLK
jgi:hypothetical protein